MFYDSGFSRMAISPVDPLTLSRVPSWIISVASLTATTQGIPNSRETITAWLIWPPTLTTTASAGTNNGVQEGSVSGAIRISPGPRSLGSEGSVMTFAVPSATPGHPPNPFSISPGLACALWLTFISDLRGQVSGSGICPSNINGGIRFESSPLTRFLSLIFSSNEGGLSINSSS